MRQAAKLFAMLGGWAFFFLPCMMPREALVIVLLLDPPCADNVHDALVSALTDTKEEDAPWRHRGPGEPVRVFRPVFMRVGLKKATETVIVLLACIPALLTALMVVAGMLMIGIGTILELTAPEWAVAWELFTAPLRALFRVLS